MEMQLKESTRQLLFDENIKEKIDKKDLSLKSELNGIVKDFLGQFGIPCKNELVSLNNRAKSYNGFYDAVSKEVVLCPNSIQDNNFQYFHTLIHESTHLIQYFLVENGISRNTIDNISLEDYQKMSRKFFKDKTITVTQEMLDKFKSFVKEEPFLENEKMKYLVQDILKYKNFGTIYYNNIGEIMANDFGIRELQNILKENSITKEQYKQLNECLDKDEKKIDKIKPEQKKITSLAQNILTMPQNHIRHIIALARMKLSPIVENSQEMLGDTQYEVSENAKDVRMFIDIDDKKKQDGAITKFVTEKKEQLVQLFNEEQEISFADDILSNDNRFVAFGALDKTEDLDKDIKNNRDDDLDI